MASPERQKPTLSPLERDALRRVISAANQLVQADMQTTDASARGDVLLDALSSLYERAEGGSDLERVAGEIRSQLSASPLDALEVAAKLQRLRDIAPDDTRDFDPFGKWNSEMLNRIRHLPTGSLKRITFLLGAGASVPSNIPPIDGLLDEIWTRASRSDAGAALQGLHSWCDENGVKNVEVLMTALELARILVEDPVQLRIVDSVIYGEEHIQGRRELLAADLEREFGERLPSPMLTRLREIVARRTGPSVVREAIAVTTVGDTLETFFDFLVGTMIAAEPNAFHEAAARVAKDKLDKGCAFITTNYDALIELALKKAGLIPEYGIGKSSSPNESAVVVVKPHGSINWYYCENCQRLRMPAIDLIRDAARGELPVPSEGVCDCLGRVTRMIIPPTFLKVQPFPPIIQLINEVRLRLERTDTLVVVGYSFSDIAEYLVRMILRRLAAEDAVPLTLILVDPSTRVIQRVRGLIRRNVPKYDDKVHFLPIVGKAEVEGLAVTEALLGPRAVGPGQAAN